MSQAAIILFVSLVVFLILNVPVGIAIGLASLCVVFNSSRLSDSFMVQQLITGTDSFPIMAIPLFILAGELMAAGGVSKRILNVCSAYFGHITGGLAIVTVVVCMFFAAVSGSGPATVAAVGAMVVPAMLEKGYSKSFTLACIACSGCIGVIIPPSIPMVIYGVSTTTSITGMFMAGFLPGIFIGLCLCLLCYFYCKKMGWKGDDKRYTSKERLAIIWDAKWALIDRYGWTESQAHHHLEKLAMSYAVMHLPMRFLCKPDCQGYVQYLDEEDPDTCQKELTGQHPFAALQQLLSQSGADQE